MPLLLSHYEAMILQDISREIQEYVEDIPYKKNMIAALCTNAEDKKGQHHDRIFEWTTHPSQTWDTLIKQKVREAKHSALRLFDQGESINSSEYAEKCAKTIFEECKKRIYSLENAKIPAHAQMTPLLLQKVPSFFRLYNRYATIPQWKAEEKAEEKNISFAAFLDEEKQDPVYLDERLEAVMTAKKMLLSGESKFYQWIDFDGAKRPDGIMLSIFAELLIDDINQSARGISEQDFVRKDSLFTLAEREENRNLVSEFHRIDRSIFALTRHLAGNHEDSENPVYIAQMEQLKRKREWHLRKLVKMRDESKRRKSSSSEADIVYLSERVHFIPRFDPKFIIALQKSELGNSLNLLSKSEMQHYKTASHIIDQILTINTISPDTVCQIILAQCTCAQDIITIEQFLKEKGKRWKERLSQFSAADPLESLSLCPLLETKKTTTVHHVVSMLDTLLAFYGKKDFTKRIPEFFFAGSDLSKSMGSASSFTQTWRAAIAIWEWSKKNDMDVRVKLGTGESTFRQSGFLDPHFDISVFAENLPEEKISKLRECLGPHWNDQVKRKGNGLLSLLRKYPWLNAITLQSKAREWAMSMGSLRLSKLLNTLKETKAQNMKILSSSNPQHFAPSAGVEVFVKEENRYYEAIIGSEEDTNKDPVSLPALIELFATEITPVLRDRTLKRESGGEKISGVHLREKITASQQINARAIAANTASSVLYPLALLGKGEGFAALSSDQYHSVLLSFEAFDLLQTIRQFSAIAPHVFSTLMLNGFESVANTLEPSWQQVQKMVPFLIEAILKDSFPCIAALPKSAQKECIACFTPSLKAMLSASYSNENGLRWDFSSPSLDAMQENWEQNAASIVAKACQFLSCQTNAYPFSAEDVAQWDTFLTLHCRLRGDKGLLG